MFSRNIVSMMIKGGINDNTAGRIYTVYEIRPQICRDFKCDKPQKEIEGTKEHFSYDGRFHIFNLREIFK